MITAVPNWTGRLPVVGAQLAGLFALWLAGRQAVATSAMWPVGVAETIDMLFPIVLGLVILREIVVGKNWRNLVVFVLRSVFALAGRCIVDMRMRRELGPDRWAQLWSET